MQNVKYEVIDNILIIKVDLNEKFGLTGSGKSTSIAKTGPSHKIEGTDITIGLNVYEKIKDGEK
jgi:hypothetical protein